ncbi:hypothetical protein [Flavobacterium restrictum]|uniref:Uncharacterized protein n=1 Tax=Flavobacterium restrictum TaxID=2594428 RepID=A0A553E8V9_9FLAO|nr:hypothetical protein [Flavobacterium restrictum]TRX41430.1 hypothetical protein FNW21_04850 [Flavobacterium restrictum]
MPKKEVTLTNFAFSFAFLKQLADSTLLLIDRDTVQFTDRGFNPAKRTTFVNALNAFAAFPTDEQMTALKSDITDTKQAQRNNLEKLMRTMLLAAKNSLGENSAKYREFGNTDVSRELDSDLARMGKMMVTAATKYLTTLATEGITATKITTLTTAVTSFDISIDLQTQATNNRDNSTEQRILLANTLYALIIKHSETGKDIWVEESEAKYNDYVIYDTPSGTPEVVTPPVVPPTATL